MLGAEGAGRSDDGNASVSSTRSVERDAVCCSNTHSPSSSPAVVFGAGGASGRSDPQHAPPCSIPPRPCPPPTSTPPAHKGTAPPRSSREAARAPAPAPAPAPTPPPPPAKKVEEDAGAKRARRR